MVGPGVDLLFCNKQEALNWCDTDDIEVAMETMQKTAKAICHYHGR